LFNAVYVRVKSGAGLKDNPRTLLGEIRNYLIAEILLYLREEEILKMRALVTAVNADKSPDDFSEAWRFYLEHVLLEPLKTSLRAEDKYSAAAEVARKLHETGQRESPEWQLDELYTLLEQRHILDENIESDRAAAVERYKRIIGK